MRSGLLGLRAAGPRAAGPLGRWAAGPWAAGRWAAGLLLAKPPKLNPVVINDKLIDVVSRAKILGVNILSDLKWNRHTIYFVLRKLLS